MTDQTLDEALTLTEDGEGGLIAPMTGSFSNAPMAWPAEKGSPFGGLMAALAARAARQSLRSVRSLCLGAGRAGRAAGDERSDHLRSAR